MKRLGWGVFVGLLLVAVATSESVSATYPVASQTVVINGVQLRGEKTTGESSIEMVEITNVSFDLLDISGWCLRIGADDKLSCIDRTVPNQHILLPSGGSTQFTSNDYNLKFGLSNTLVLKYALNNTSGYVDLVDTQKDVVDRVGWGNTQVSETAAISNGFTSSAGPAGIHRLNTVDTGNNSIDFSPTNLMVTMQPDTRTILTDHCRNLDGIQTVFPEGMDETVDGDCYSTSLDMCVNVDYIQLTFPSGMLADEAGECALDICTNIEGLQVTKSDGYVVTDGVCLLLENRPIVVTELLANVAGSDVGHEFIELYNPNDSVIQLAGYSLAIGKNFEKDYALSLYTAHTFIEPHARIVIYDNDLDFSLLNTESGVQVVAPDGTVVSEVFYSEPGDDMSWSLFKEGWAYTNQITPGAPNERSIVPSGQVDENDVTQLTPCGTGKYRHPITNRCRNIEGDTAMLVACDNDEYRNPETNRCRKIATLASSLTACDDGYERSSETNRCRKVASVTTELTACKAGYERNPETNRCRKSAVVTSTAAVADKQDNEGASLQTAVLVTAGVSAVSYGLYEWRSEFMQLVRRLIKLPFGK